MLNFLCFLSKPSCFMLLCFLPCKAHSPIQLADIYLVFPQRLLAFMVLCVSPIHRIPNTVSSFYPTMSFSCVICFLDHRILISTLTIPLKVLLLKPQMTFDLLNPMHFLWSLAYLTQLLCLIMSWSWSSLCTLGSWDAPYCPHFPPPL